MLDRSLFEQKMFQALSSLAVEQHIELFLAYIYLLIKWNKAYNLTAIRDPFAMITHHIMDSLAVLPFIRGNSLVDVGSGAGLPGIPFAITQPDLHIVLLDSNQKKAAFLREIKRQLHLNNVMIYAQRAEDFHIDQYFDTVSCRALTTLQQFVQWTKHLISTQGLWLAMKGHIPKHELSILNRPYQVKNYTVDQLHEARCAILIEAY